LVVFEVGICLLNLVVGHYSFRQHPVPPHLKQETRQRTSEQSLPHSKLLSQKNEFALALMPPLLMMYIPRRKQKMPEFDSGILIEVSVVSMHTQNIIDTLSGDPLLLKASNGFFFFFFYPP
jgi:hypothetical protein